MIGSGVESIAGTAMQVELATLPASNRTAIENEFNPIQASKPAAELGKYHRFSLLKPKKCYFEDIWKTPSQFSPGPC